MKTQINWEKLPEPNWKGNYVLKDDRWMVTLFKNTSGYWCFKISERPLFKAVHERLKSNCTAPQDLIPEIKAWFDALPWIDD